MGFSLFSDLLSFLLRKAFFSEFCLTGVAIETRKGKRKRKRKTEHQNYCSIVVT